MNVDADLDRILSEVFELEKKLKEKSRKHSQIEDNIKTTLKETALLTQDRDLMTHKIEHLVFD